MRRVVGKDGRSRRRPVGARRSSAAPVRTSPAVVVAAVVIGVQAVGLLVWLVWQLAMHPPGCVDDTYCNVLDGPLVRQAPVGFAVAAAWAIMGYRVARGFRVARLTALVAELLLAAAVVATDVWGEDVVDSGHIALSALVAAAALVAHDAGDTIRHLRRQAS